MRRFIKCSFFLYFDCIALEALKLFFLGHMAWAYVLAVVFAGKHPGKLFVPAVLMLAVLPDVDLFFGSYFGILLMDALRSTCF